MTDYFWIINYVMKKKPELNTIIDLCKSLGDLGFHSENIKKSDLIELLNDKTKSLEFRFSTDDVAALFYLGLMRARNKFYLSLWTEQDQTIFFDSKNSKKCIKKMINIIKKLYSILKPEYAYADNSELRGMDDKLASNQTDMIDLNQINIVRDLEDRQIEKLLDYYKIEKLGDGSYLLISKKKFVDWVHYEV